MLCIKKISIFEVMRVKFVIRNIGKKLKQLTSQLIDKIDLLLYKHEECELVIVTGADTSHYKSLNQFLLSLYVHEPSIRVIVVDLGFTLEERQSLKSCFPTIELRLFDYSMYPDYFNIKINAGEYAWKPVIFSEILKEFKCCVCWMDAGNKITAPLFGIRRITKAIGMYSPHSSGYVSTWTHPKMLEFMDVSNSLLSKNNLNGACVSVDYQNQRAMSIVSKWEDCAMTKGCIAPIGSSRKNHRQDQAALSVLAHQSGITKNMTGRLHGFVIHQDID
jgi:hypothetical protein